MHPTEKSVLQVSMERMVIEQAEVEDDQNCRQGLRDRMEAFLWLLNTYMTCHNSFDKFVPFNFFPLATKVGIEISDPQDLMGH